VDQHGWRRRRLLPNLTAVRNEAELDVVLCDREATVGLGHLELGEGQNRVGEINCQIHA
jgi:hypothetical protein